MASVQQVFNCDCTEVLEAGGKWDLIFMDPPDNIGLNYDKYIDRRGKLEYYSWIMYLLRRAMQLAPVVWITYNQEHDVEIKKRLGMGERALARQIIWHWTFGRWQRSDFIRSYRPFLRFSSLPASMEHIGVPTQRMLSGDQRASGSLKPPDDVWEFPRVMRGHADYCSYIPTQLPVGILCRIIKSHPRFREPGFRVLDLFGGSMSFLKACKQIGVTGYACEISESYCRKSGFPVSVKSGQK